VDGQLRDAPAHLRALYHRFSLRPATARSSNVTYISGATLFNVKSDRASGAWASLFLQE